jgi:hypothetical protein
MAHLHGPSIRPGVSRATSPWRTRPPCSRCVSRAGLLAQQRGGLARSTPGEQNTWIDLHGAT